MDNHDNAMTNQEIHIVYQEYNSIEEMNPEDRELAAEAIKAMEGAYAPYSHFHVGAAVRMSNGQIVREGTDVALIACGLMVNIALEAAEQLAGYGVSARVVNMPTIKPLDNDLVLDCARTIGKIVTCEEHSVIGGLGSAVCELTSRMCPVPVSRLGVNDVFGKSGDVPGLFEEYGLTAAHIVKKVNSLLA